MEGNGKGEVQTIDREGIVHLFWMLLVDSGTHAWLIHKDCFIFIVTSPRNYPAHDSDYTRR